MFGSVVSALSGDGMMLLRKLCCKTKDTHTKTQTSTEKLAKTKKRVRGKISRPVVPVLGVR